MVLYSYDKTRQDATTHVGRAVGCWPIAVDCFGWLTFLILKSKGAYLGTLHVGGQKMPCLPSSRESLRQSNQGGCSSPYSSQRIHTRVHTPTHHTVHVIIALTGVDSRVVTRLLSQLDRHPSTQLMLPR